MKPEAPSSLGHVTPKINPRDEKEPGPAWRALMDFNDLEQLYWDPHPSTLCCCSVKVQPQGAVLGLSWSVLNLAWFGLPDPKRAIFIMLGSGRTWMGCANCPKIEF